MSTDLYHHLSHDAAPGAPLVFAFHGTGGDERQFFSLLRELLPEAGIVAPRGDVSEHGALRYFRRTGEGVYDMDDLERRTAAMAAFVRAHIAGRRPSEVVGLGYSNGANILASVMLAAPELVDTAVLMHPLIPWTPGDVAGLAGRRVLITAGERDPICPAPQTRALADHLARQGAEVTLDWHPGGHEVPPSEIEAIRRFLG